MDSVDFAVLTKVQELTGRYGLKPYEVLATLDHSMQEPILAMGVKFHVMTDYAKADQDADSIEKRAADMLKSIGVEDGGILGGGEKAVLDALDAALKKAPKPSIKR